jgi:glycosyltransferase involved in cell wall biosynthesis
VAIDAVRMLRKSKPELKVVCLFPGGAGYDGPEIEGNALKDEADAAAFRFLGFRYGGALRECYWAADIVLLPSRFEGFGLVIPEAMSCGCVPVRTPGGGARDQIVDGVNGYLVPFNDPHALADRIDTLSIPPARAAMRETAMAYAEEHFDQEKMVSTTADLYQAIVRAGAHTSS